MKAKRLSVDQIAIHLSDMEDLLGQGLKVDEACRKIGISENSYQRWRREYGGRKPDHLRCLESFEAADKSRDVIEMLDNFTELRRHLKEGRTPRKVGFALARKISLLTKAHDICANASFKPSAKLSSESWDHPDADSDIVQTKVHDALVDEFSKMIHFYMARAEKTGQSVRSDLVTDASIDVKGNVGKQVSSALASYFAGLELPKNQIQQLKDGWSLLGAYIEQLLRSAKT